MYVILILSKHFLYNAIIHEALSQTDICILGFGSSAMNLILMCSMNFMPISYQTDTEFIMVIHSYYPSILLWRYIFSYREMIQEFKIKNWNGLFNMYLI